MNKHEILESIRAKAFNEVFNEKIAATGEKYSPKEKTINSLKGLGIGAGIGAGVGAATMGLAILKNKNLAGIKSFGRMIPGAKAVIKTTAKGAGTLGGITGAIIGLNKKKQS